jgi:hypothetical protein
MWGVSSQMWSTQKSRTVYLQKPRSGNWYKQTVRWRPEWDWKRCMVVISEDLQGLLRKSQSIELSRFCAGHVDFLQSDGMQHKSENPLSESHLDFFFFPQKISAKSVKNTVKDFAKTLWLWKGGTKQVDLNYVGRLLLDSEEGCTWRQI